MIGSCRRCGSGGGSQSSSPEAGHAARRSDPASHRLVLIVAPCAGPGLSSLLVEKEVSASRLPRPSLPVPASPVELPQRLSRRFAGPFIGNTPPGVVMTEGPLHRGALKVTGSSTKTSVFPRIHLSAWRCPGGTLRSAVALLVVLFAFANALAPAEFASSVGRFQVLPPALVVPSSLAVILAACVVGLMLLLHVHAPYASLVAAGLMSVFSLFIVRALSGGAAHTADVSRDVPSMRALIFLGVGHRDSRGGRRIVVESGWPGACGSGFSPGWGQMQSAPGEARTGNLILTPLFATVFR